MTLHLVPVSFRDACGFVELWHRHHDAPQGCKFCTAVADEHGILHGVAIVGRPVARLFAWWPACRDYQPAEEDR